MRTFILFLMVGAFTATIYFCVLIVLLEFLLIDYRVAVSVAYVSAVTFHFISNRRVTFRSNEARVLPQIIRYLPMIVLNYVLTICVVTVSVETLGFSPYLGAALAIVVTTGVGFCMSKQWIFK